MSITLETRQLKAVASEASAVAISSASPSAPIFANVLIVEGEGGRVTFSATDLDSAIERQLQAVKGDFARAPLRVTVSARYLSAIAGKLPPDAQVALVMDDGTQLKLTSGRSRFTLATLPAEDFPSFVRDKWSAQFDIPALELASLIDRLAFAISTDETRYYLGGIYFHRVESEGSSWLRAATTDGSRLARAQVALPEGAEDFPESGVIVPRKALGVVRKLIDHMKPGTEDAPAMIGVAVSDRRIEFDLGEGENGETRFAAKLIDGTFPDYARVIPTANTGLLKVEKAVLREAVERVSTIISEKARAVKLAIVKDMLTLTATSVEAGQALEEVPCEYRGEDLEIGFNSKFLLDVLNRVDGTSVVAELADAAAPTLWRDEAEPEILFVLMPLRV